MKEKVAYSADYDSTVVEKQADEIDSYNLINELSFCVMDLETTGGDHNYDKIIEIGLIKIVKLEIVEELSYLIKPGIHIPEFIQKLTSISENDLLDAPLIEDVLDRILKFIGDSILVAHNSSFDIPFFNSILKRAKYPTLNNPAICTNLMTKYLIPEIMNSNLTYIGELFGIEHKKAHRALEDAKVAAKVLINYLQFFIEKKIKKVNHLYYPRKKYELDSIHVQRQKNDNTIEVINKISKIDIPLLITIKGEKGVILDVLPISNPPAELDMISTKLKSIDWNVISLKIAGSFFKVLLFYNSSICRINNSDAKAWMINYLNYKYLKDFDQNNVKEDKFFDKYFLLTNHLVKDQFVIYSLSSLFSKNELIFRYPSHQKKLMYFVNFKNKNNNKNEKEKSVKIALDNSLKAFFYGYLSRMFVDNYDKDYVFISSELVNKRVKEFKGIVAKFTTNSKNTFNYPQKHI
ncbi:MAG: 3'-5' exonuclease [Oligoflexia bacterium]|nr:3'-5' exonuclease [Oligoflexia bacterium]